MPDTLGQDIRALRLARGMTLEELSFRVGRSTGWLSQVERDKSQPRMSDLRKLADTFEVPLSLLFGAPDAPEAERGRIVRAHARRKMGDPEQGLIETLISPDLTDSFEVIHSVFLPRTEGDELIRRPTQEVAYLVSGQLDIELDDQPFTVSEGDSFRIRRQSFRWFNPYDAPAVAVWVISPPVY
ncbi:transcriptional regulator, XRE family with cupin sensor [Pseudooceanicola antarcticus]|uniref:Transcriptional regulator, XRE family with cupin sensor n=1 Tax=Pseudooceanicola antarcticus TaxID=1247613 RepID=A0A285IQZ0_9RHOB|nr:XRE family transcriptional regulator [Pseudooceanicola antarcticus]PJE31783.1 XRE family transcriptional regulator [Pseudooceanicola antarcticus]SNY50382.1 transcriptional regulator, XRE family with cupin sensor [Pseudooceanicola antarcticus]